MQPHNIKLYLQQAELLLSQGETSRAIAYCNAALAKLPNDINLRKALNKCLKSYHGRFESKESEPNYIILPKSNFTHVPVVGESDYKAIIDEKRLLVDKTLFIKEIIDDKTQVKSIIRPRRFGKTLNLSMLKYFFEKTEIENEHARLFINKTIWNEGEYYQRQQGQYPVLFITFKTVKANDYNEAYKHTQYLLSELYKQYRGFLFDGILKNNSFGQKDYDAIIGCKASYVETAYALKQLTTYLYKAYNKRTIVLIDDYDTPLWVSQKYGYYAQMLELLKEMLHPLIKDNPCLQQCVLTGILRIAKADLLYKLDHIRLFSAVSNSYAMHFGFSLAEVKALLGIVATPDVIDTLQLWYGGYRIGSQHIFNSWSVINFIQDNLVTAKQIGILCPYWIDSTENALLIEQFSEPNFDMKEDLRALLENKFIAKKIDEHMEYSDITKNKQIFWSFLFLCGYLTSMPTDKTVSPEGESIKLFIPNREVYMFFASLSKKWFKNEIIPFAFKRADEMTMPAEEETILAFHKNYFIKAINEEEKLLIAETLIYYGYIDNVILIFLLESLIAKDQQHKKLTQTLFLYSNVIKHVMSIDTDVANALLISQRYSEYGDVLRCVAPLFAKLSIPHDSKALAAAINSMPVCKLIVLKEAKQSETNKKKEGEQNEKADNKSSASLATKLIVHSAVLVQAKNDKNTLPFKQSNNKSNDRCIIA